MSTRRKALLAGDGTSTMKTVAPEKPPRGFLRSGPVRIEPLPLASVANQEKNLHASKSPSLSHYRFSTTEKYANMKNYFREMVEVRDGGEFSGFEAVNILDDYLQTNREQFSANIVRRENSVKVLDMWLRENVIRSLNASSKDSPPLFCDSKKAMYIMNPDSDHKLYICSTPTSLNKSVGRRPSRTSSFKRFFSPSRLKSSEGPARHAFVSRSPSTTSQPTPRVRRAAHSSNLFTMDCRVPNSKQLSLEEEAELHDASLFRLLTIVEIPVLDDLTNVPGQPTKSASILSTILSKIGLGGSIPEIVASREEEMDDLLEDTPSIRQLVPWFQLARICAPGLYFKSSGDKPTREEIHSWAKASVQAVHDRYSAITHRGSSPLFPMEFSSIIEAIIEQLLGRNKTKTSLALQYLCLMIPQQLRTHLCNIVQFLERTLGTDEFMSLQDPYFLGKRGDSENYEFVFDEVRLFIFPQKVERLDQQRLIEALIELRKEGRLGKQPPELITDLKRLRENLPNSTVPVRFCQAGSAKIKFDADAEVAHALAAIIDSSRLSLAEKQKKCELFREHHPSIYRKYFSHLNW